MKNTQMKKFVSFCRAVARDLTALAGVASVTYGAWLVYEPMGYLVFGSIALAAYIAPMIAGS